MKKEIRATLDANISDVKKRCEAEVTNLIESAKTDCKKIAIQEAACDIRFLYDSFVEAGFNEEEAWEILKIQLSKQGGV